MKAYAFAFASILLLATAAHAQQQQTAQPPKSGLGKEVPADQKRSGQAAEIVTPKPQEILEQALTEIEGLQLNDDQMDRIKRLYVRKERQRATPYVTPPTPVTRTLPINLEPGRTPPSLRLSRGQLSSVVFSDKSGQPWFIEDVRLNREMFSDGKGGGQGKGEDRGKATNVLTIEPLGAAAYGNVTVTLKGLPTPVILLLSAAQQEVDLRIDAVVPGRNPDALDTVNFTSMPGIDGSLTSFLDGVPPKAAKSMRVTGLPDTEAWTYQDSLYVRTDADAQYPAYYSAARSTTGKAVYRFAAGQSNVTLLANGRAVTIFIEE